MLALTLVVFAEKVLPSGQRAYSVQLVDVNIIEGVGAETPHGLVQLGGEFDARCPAPIMAQSSCPGRCGSYCALARKHALISRRLGARRFIEVIELDRVFGDPGRSEIVANAADRDHEWVMAENPRYDFTPLVIEARTCIVGHARDNSVNAKLLGRHFCPYDPVHYFLERDVTRIIGRAVIRLPVAPLGRRHLSDICFHRLRITLEVQIARLGGNLP